MEAEDLVKVFLPENQTPSTHGKEQSSAPAGTELLCSSEDNIDLDQPPFCMKAIPRHGKRIGIPIGINHLHHGVLILTTRSVLADDSQGERHID